MICRVVVIPLTSNTDRLYPGEALVTIGAQASKAMVDQIMAADKARLHKKLSEIKPDEMKQPYKTRYGSQRETLA